MTKDRLECALQTSMSTRSFVSDDEDGASKACSDGDRDELSEVKKIASRETKRVNLWRRVILFLIFAAGAGVSYMTYAFLSSEENDNHKEAFEQFANSIDDIISFRVENMFNGLRGFSEMLTAHAQRNGEEWPLVTLPNFEVVAEHTRVQTQVEFINFAPLVQPYERTEFEAYAYDNQWWIQESREFTLGKEGTLVETSDFVDMEISGSITARCETGLCPSPNVTDREYAPIWQVSPPPFIPILVGSDSNNGDLLRRDLDAMEETRDLVMGAVFRTSFITGASISADAHSNFHAKFVSPTIGNTTADDRPHFLANTPVFRVLGDRYSEMVGLVVSVVALDAYMANLLPSTVTGIDLVVRSTCNQTFTYQIDGSFSVYVGPDDFHDPTYDDSEVVVDFNSFLDSDLSINTPGHCVYTFSLYPTKTFVESYKTPLPAIFTAVVAATFLLLASVFFIYDYMGARRNEKVEDAAARSNSIVASLFPSKIRAKLIEQANIRAKARTESHLATPRKRLRAFVHGDSPKQQDDKDGRNTVVETDDQDNLFLPGKPLADLFSATTIMFADIVGFTSWSSSREPFQVFMLLETIYRAFDMSAKRRKIFKVETIGDCYVAVAGIPDPREDHALAMCRFARDCQARMTTVVQMLEETLGEDTSHLRLRIGLHSGPCTAGVLRGEKSRFQLFGDTMNTASRMESTGVSNKIQVSQETADQLIMSGKSEWLQPREDRIIAKGKGVMQTYWLVTSRQNSIPSAQDDRLEGSDSQ